MPKHHRRRANPIWILVPLILLVAAASIYLYLFRRVQVTKTTPDTGNSSSLIPNLPAGPLTVSSMVIPHFDGAKADRQAAVSKLAAISQPKTVILVSVNHFNAGPADIETTNKKWSFQSTSPKIDDALFRTITADGTAKDSEVSFNSEHGIANVLPDLTNSFSKAKFLPIIIKDSANKSTIDALFTKLYEACSGCLLVASVDFSHYNPAALAAIHDQTSLYGLSIADANSLWQAETDSPQTLYLLARWANAAKTTSFNLIKNSNSGIDLGNIDAETTSYIIGYYANQSATQILKETTLLLGGDAMFDRMVNHTFKNTGTIHVFDNLGNRVFWGTDISMLNLEGPISPTPIDDNIDPDSLVFNFPPDTPDALKFIKVKTVSLGNNHAANMSFVGSNQTKVILDQNSISYVGEPDGFNPEYSVIRINAPIPVSILSVNALASFSEDQMDKAIRAAKDAGDKVLIFPHWGSEYQPKHSTAQSNLAHHWITVGADVIIGSHPHVVQDVEIYQKRPIVYSMGNLVFDQTFSAETMHGLLVGGIITDTDITLSFFPTVITAFRPQLDIGSSKITVLHSLLANLDDKDYTKIREDTIKIGW